MLKKDEETDEEIDEAILKVMGHFVIILGYFMSINLLCVSVLCLVIFFQNSVVSAFFGLFFLILAVYSYYKNGKMRKKYLGD